MLANVLVTFLAVVFSSSAICEVPQQERDHIDSVTSGKGTYVDDDGVYKVIFPREDATFVRDGQTLSPNLGLNSWIAFKSAVHHEAIATGQILLLQDEVDAVLAKALDSGLVVTGLASSPFFAGPRLRTLDIVGVGSFQDLAAAFRLCLDEIELVRRGIRTKSAPPEAQLVSAIDPDPLDKILSMKGVVIEGVYRAAIGTRTLLYGELIGREMGMSTWVSFAGTNARAVMHGELVTGPNDLQTVLKALSAKSIQVASIRDHTVAERPQVVFVHFWSEGSAIDMANAIRYVLNAQIGLRAAEPF
jgi:hypothetical protein